MTRKQKIQRNRKEMLNSALFQHARDVEYALFKGNPMWPFQSDWHKLMEKYTGKDTA